MNVVKNDFNGLLGQLSIAADKEFTEKQAVELVAAFRELGWEGSRRVVEAIRTSASIPRNLYGYTLSALDEELRYKRKQEYQREYWKVADSDKASPEEFQITMRTIGLLCSFEHSTELLIKFGEYMENAVSELNFMEIMNRAETFYREQIEKQNKLKPENNISVLQVASK